MPVGTRSKAMDVVIAKNRIKVGLKGQPAVLEVSAETVEVDSSAPRGRGRGKGACAKAMDVMIAKHCIKVSLKEQPAVLEVSGIVPRRWT